MFIIKTYLKKKVSGSKALIVALILSTGLIIGVLQHSDYIAYANFKKRLSRIPFSSEVTMMEHNYSSYYYINNGIVTLNFIKDYSVLSKRLQSQLYLLVSKNNSFKYQHVLRDTIFIGLVSQNDWDGALNITGVFPRDTNDIMLSSDVAKKLGIDLGDKINITIPGLGSNYLVFNVSGIFEICDVLYKVVYDFPLGESSEGIHVEPLNIYGGIFGFNLEKALKYKNDTISFILLGIIYYFFTYDIDSFLNPWAPDASLRKLRELDNELLHLFSAYTDKFYLKDYVEDIFEDFVYWISALRYELTYAIIPSFFIGWLMTYIAVDLTINSRRKEIGLLRLRGSSDPQIFISILLESFILGAISGFTGYFFGIVSEIIFAHFVSSEYLNFQNPLYVVARNMINYLIISILTGLFFSVIAFMIMIFKVKKLTLLESVREYHEELAMENIRTGVDYFIFLVSLVSLIEIFLGLPILRNIVPLILQEPSILMQIIGILILVVDVILIAVGPLLFAYSGSKLLASYIASTVKLFSKLARRIMGDMSEIAVKLFSRNPKRVASIIFLISVIISFTLSFNVSTESQVNAITISTKLEVGSNFKIHFLSDKKFDGSPINYTEIENLILNINGVKKVVYAGTIWTHMNLHGEIITVRLVAVGSDYFDTVFLGKSCIISNNAQKVAEDFKNGYGALISLTSNKLIGEIVGNNLTVEFSIGAEKISFNTRILGQLSFLPGLMSQMYELQTEDYVTLIVNMKTIETISGGFPIEYLFVKTANTELDNILEDIVDAFGLSGISVNIYAFHDILDAKLNERPIGILPKIFRIELVLTIPITIEGLAIVMLISAIERRKENSLLIVKGAAKEQVIKIFLTETLIIIISSFLLSLITATAYAKPLLEVGIQSVLYEKTIPPPGIGIYISPLLVQIFLIESFFMFAAAMIPCVFELRKLDVTRELKSFL